LLTSHDAEADAFINPQVRSSTNAPSPIGIRRFRTTHAECARRYGDAARRSPLIGLMFLRKAAGIHADAGGTAEFIFALDLYLENLTKRFSLNASINP